MSRDALLRELRAVLETTPEVRLAMLFGSQARGEASPGSDVDLAVDAPGLDRLSLIARLEAALGRPVDVVLLDGAKLPLLREVVREGVMVLERPPGAYGTFLSRALLELETDLPMIRRVQRAFVDRVASHGLFGPEVAGRR